MEETDNDELNFFKVEVEEFIRETEKINNDFVETVNNINTEFRSVDSIFSKHRRQKKLYLEIQSQLKQLKSEGLESSESSELESLRHRLDGVGVIVDNLGKSKRKTGSYFVSLIMGKVSVRIWNKGDRYKFKSEYNRFKERWMSIFFIFPAIQIIFGFSGFLNQLQCLLFFFYYTSLAIRENILSLNGSRIESWWIYHHYWSIAISILSLIIYNDNMDKTILHSLIYLDYFFFYQGIVMLLQNDYQKKRHYARKALAKKGQFDIRTTEVIDETPHSKYKILIPALYCTYFIQLIISIYFLILSSSVSSTNYKVSIQLIIMSICWFVLSIGNCSTLSKVLKKKKKLKLKKQKNKE